MENIGIFQGKQKTYNLQILTLLFENGPLSTWNIAKSLKGSKEIHCMNAIIHKRMKNLAKLEYVSLEDKKWILRIKGTVAVILSQSEVKMFHPIWNQILETKANYWKKRYEKKNLRLVCDNEGTTEEVKITDILEKSKLFTKTFKSWVSFSEVVKTLMEKGLLNLNKISEEDLMQQINLQALSTSDLRAIIERACENNRPQ